MLYGHPPDDLGVGVDLFLDKGEETHHAGLLIQHHGFFSLDEVVSSRNLGGGFGCLIKKALTDHYKWRPFDERSFWWCFIDRRTGLSGFDGDSDRLFNALGNIDQ
ncbi:hypothetical protein D3C77_481440 [compost metagenome]